MSPTASGDACSYQPILPAYQPTKARLILLDPAARRANLRLYRSRLALCLEDLYRVIHRTELIFDTETYAEARRLCAKDGSSGFDYFFDAILRCTDERFYDCVIQMLRGRGTVECQILSQLLRFRHPDTGALLHDISLYERVLHQLDPALQLLDSKTLQQVVRAMHGEYEDLVAQEMSMDDDAAAGVMFLLRDMPHVHGWYWNFMDALGRVGGSALELQHAISPEYEEEQQERANMAVAPELVNSEESLQSKDSGVLDGGVVEPPDSEATHAMFNPFHPFHTAQLDAFEAQAEQRMEREEQQRQSVAARRRRNIRAFDPNIEVEEIQLRVYQQELAKDALRGLNTAVVARTGSGKTVVAIKVIAEHLAGGGAVEESLFEATTSSQTKRRVVFIVPTVDLVDQQATMMERFLANRYTIACLVGGPLKQGEPPRHRSVLDSDITVLTPQILVNMLEDVKEEQRLALTDISLLVLDECHHVRKESPYMRVMRLYDAAWKEVGEESVPQVLGLTASLGVGGKSNVNDATSYILQILARLHAHSLSTVRSKAALQELNEKVPQPFDKPIGVDPPSERVDKFCLYLRNSIAHIEKELMKDNMLADVGMQIPVVEDKSKQREAKTLPEYVTFACELLQKSAEVSEAERHRTLCVLAEHLVMYVRALQLAFFVPHCVVLEKLRERINKFENKADYSRNKVERAFVERFRNDERTFGDYCTRCRDEPAIDCPLFTKLIEVLVEEYSERPTSRTFVFVETVELTELLRERIGLSSELKPFELNPGRLVGSSKSKDEDGMKDEERREALEKFNSGDCKLLVVTSVAEEGLDVAECNLVVKYNTATNEVAMVQRMGRGRAAGSRSILLYVNKETARREMKNVIRMKYMDFAVQQLTHYSTEDFKRKLDEKRSNFVVAENKQKVKDEVVRRRLQDRRYDMLCRDCMHFITKSTCVRRIGSGGHFVIVDAKIWSRVNARAHRVDEELRSYAYVTETGKYTCKGCNRKLGSVLHCASSLYPCPKVEAFVLRRQPEPENKKLDNPRQWKKITEEHFFVEQLSNADEYTMMDAEQRPNLYPEQLGYNCEISSKELEQLEEDEIGGFVQKLAQDVFDDEAEEGETDDWWEQMM